MLYLGKREAENLTFLNKVDSQSNHATYAVESRIEPRPHWWRARGFTIASASASGSKQASSATLKESAFYGEKNESFEYILWRFCPFSFLF